MPEPIWQLYRIVVDVDVEAVDSDGHSFFLGAKEIARMATCDALGFKNDISQSYFDKDGECVRSCNGRVKFRMPKHWEEA